jgi:hypothetical protein
MKCTRHPPGTYAAAERSLSFKSKSSGPVGRKTGSCRAKTRVRGCSTSRDVAALLEALDRSKDGLELDTLREALPISPPAPATRVSDRGMKSISKSLSGRMALWTVR